MSANRGKAAEDKFRAICKEYEGAANFAFHRFPDAHAGSLVTAPADFQTLYDGKMRLIEVKETKAGTRLPYTNFRPDQVARMRLWKLAGAEAWVVVADLKNGLYSCFDVDAFLKRSEGQASWFFTEEEPTTVFQRRPAMRSKSLKEVFKSIHNM